MICLSTGFNETCFMNTTANYMAIHLPHFSTIGGLVIGSATTASDSGSSGSGSGGGGGGGGTNTYTITETQFTSGYEQTLNPGDSIKINLTGTIHFVTLSGLRNRTSATIVVMSTPQIKIFNEGESQDFDVTNDSVNDLKVTLTTLNFTLGNAKIKVTKIITTNPGTTASPTTNPSTNPTTTSSQGVGTASLGEEKTISSTTWWTITVIAVIVVLFILIALIVTKYQSYKEKLMNRKIRIYGSIAK